MGVEEHLLRLARVGSHEQHPAVEKPDVGDLHSGRRAIDHHVLFVGETRHWRLS